MSDKTDLMSYAAKKYLHMILTSIVMRKRLATVYWFNQACCSPMHTYSFEIKIFKSISSVSIELVFTRSVVLHMEWISKKKIVKTKIKIEFPNHR